MTNRNVDAKKIFDKHNGSYYAMSLDGSLETYKSYDIKEEEEKKWKSEKKIKLLEDLESGIKQKISIYRYFSNFTKLILSDNNFDGFNYIIAIISKYVNNLDDFEKLLISEKIIQISRKYINFKDILMKSINIETYLSNLSEIQSALLLNIELYKNISKYDENLTESRVEKVKLQTIYFEEQVKKSLIRKQNVQDKSLSCRIYYDNKRGTDTRNYIYQQLNKINSKNSPIQKLENQISFILEFAEIKEDIPMPVKIQRSRGMRPRGENTSCLKVGKDILMGPRVENISCLEEKKDVCIGPRLQKGMVIEEKSTFAKLIPNNVKESSRNKRNYRHYRQNGERIK